MGAHLIDNEFQSDKYPTTPRGLVPLKCSDVDAQDLLWEYATRHRHRDLDFSEDLMVALQHGGLDPFRIYMAMERRVIVGLTVGAWRILARCVQDERDDLLDEAIEALKAAIDGLSKFRSLAGGDGMGGVGCEYTLVALRQIVEWMRLPDVDTAYREMKRRQTTDGYYESMTEAARAQGFPP
jgi:hypothetical protein